MNTTIIRNPVRIMCVVDPTAAARAAVARAAWLAEKTGAELELLVCYYNEYLSGDRLFDSPSLEKVRNEVINGHRKRLEEIAGPLRRRGLVVHTEAVWDHPLYEGIVRHAAATAADIVFKDTHHHSALSRALFSNTDWQLIRTCAVPLWLVKPGDIAQDPLFVAAVDPLHEHDKPAALDDRILALGKMLSGATGGELRVFHSCDPRLAIASATANAFVPVAQPILDVEEQVVAEHRRHFENLLDRHGIDPAATKLVSGLVHDELPAWCKAINAGVVIMGAVSRNRLQRLFIGATAEKTLEHLPCDLLIVKPEWVGKATAIPANCAA